MSIKLKRVLASVVSLAMLVTFINIPAVTSEVLAEDNPTYSLNYVKSGEETAKIAYPNPNASGDIVIESEVIIDGEVLKVTEIGMNAFAGNTNITSVDIPKTVTTIGQTAFASCSNLQSVVFDFDSTLSTIDAAAFVSCSSLSDIDLPVTVNKINAQAFAGCVSLNHIRIYDPLGSYASDIVRGCPNVMIEYPCALAGFIHEDTAVEAPFHSDFITSDTGYSCVGCGLEETAICVGHSLTLNGYIGVDFYYQISDGILANEAATVFLNSPSGPIEVLVRSGAKETVTINDVETEVYVYSCPVAAKEMTDIVTAQFNVPVDNVNTWTSVPEEYSVAQYADVLSRSEGTQYARYNNVVKAMLTYGAYAQRYFNYNPDNLPISLENNNLASMIESGSFNPEDVAPIFNSFADLIRVQGANDSVQLVAANLVLESGTTMGLYFSVPENLANEDIVYTINGDSYEATPVGPYMYVAVTNISAADLTARFRVVVTVASDSHTEYMSFSPTAYAYIVSSSEGQPVELQYLMRAMYLYGAYARSALH